MGLNFLDIMALAILLVSAVTALIKGLATEVISLASVVAGVFLAAFYYPRSASVFAQMGVSEPLRDFLGFVSLFGLSLVGGAVLIRFVDTALKTLRLKWIDRFLGGAFGLARGFLINVAIFLALTAFPVAGDSLAGSKTAGIFISGAGLLTRVVPGRLREQFKDGYQRVSRQWAEEPEQEPVAEPEADH